MKKIFLLSTLRHLAIFSTFFLMHSTSANAKDYFVENKTQYNKIRRTLTAGDNVILKNGIWEDFRITLTGIGTKESPITLSPETKGNVIITGDSNLKMAGEYLMISGLIFKDGQSPTGSVIEFRTSSPKDEQINKYVASYSRVTEVVIDGFTKLEKTKRDSWVTLYGKGNRVDHSYFQGKTNEGPLMVVKLNGDYNVNNKHLIDNNFFGHRKPLGRNGGETIRIGTSKYSMSQSGTVVTKNYFEKCNGESEIISVKSGGNFITENTIFESQGSITLRHGNGNRVERNVIIGNNIPQTGGIRVINKDQIVKDNYLESVTGTGFRSVISVMNGIPNSALNKYHQVENASITNNSIINSRRIEFGSGKDSTRQLAPKKSKFTKNFIFNKSKPIIFSLKDSIKGISFEGNIVNKDKGLPQPIKGVEKTDITVELAKNGLYYPAKSSGVTIGAPQDLVPTLKKNTGVKWYTPSSK